MFLLATLLVFTLLGGTAGAATGCLWGARVSGVPIAEFEADLGRRLGVTRIYRTWNQALPGPEAAAHAAKGRVPILSFNTRRSGSTPIPWSEIAAHRHDAALRAKARAVRDFGRPLYLIFHHEPDNVHNAGVAGEAASYVAAWRVVHRIFAEVGTPNVTWVWTLSSRGFEEEPASWYPGDAYTDLIGSDSYAYPERPWRDVSEPARRFAARRGKPLTFPEWGIGERYSDATRARLVREISAWMRDNGVVFASYYWSQRPNKPDWRLYPGSRAFAAFREVAHQPYFGGTT
ncbi:MAG: hypothetical protein H0V05_03985 [Euzebyaceae bacterium]|jgi:hypothetical protein|nr:hypothetical protein [Euzebyaceae bacterium]